MKYSTRNVRWWSKNSSLSFWLDRRTSSTDCVTVLKNPLSFSLLFLPRTLSCDKRTHTASVLTKWPKIFGNSPHCCQTASHWENPGISSRPTGMLAGSVWENHNVIPSKVPHVPRDIHTSQILNIQLLLQSTHTHTHTHTNILCSMDFVWDNPDEPVPEETFSHSHPSRPPPSTMIHGILPIQSTCFTVFFYNLSPSFLWSASWPCTLHFILHTFLHPIIIKLKASNQQKR